MTITADRAAASRPPSKEESITRQPFLPRLSAMVLNEPWPSTRDRW
jgi:hypothetical protein